jgi:hypothetical protein
MAKFSKGKDLPVKAVKRSTGKVDKGATKRINRNNAQSRESEARSRYMNTSEREDKEQIFLGRGEESAGSIMAKKAALANRKSKNKGRPLKRKERGI